MGNSRVSAPQEVAPAILAEIDKMQSEQVVDVLTLPQLTMVTRLTAASLRSLAGLLNSLADTLGRVEVVAEKVEMVSDEVEEVMTDQEDKVEDSNSCQKHP